MAKRSTKKRPRSKRDRVRSRTATLYAKRDASGEFLEMDERKRSQRVDRRRKAKKRVRSGLAIRRSASATLPSPDRC